MQRDKKINVSDSRILRKKLYQLNEIGRFETFDRFIVKKMLTQEETEELREEELSKERLNHLREKAYRVFSKQVGKVTVASRSTIKKWFGLNGYVRPKRKHIIKLAFALGLNEEELQEYLVRGILQQGIQINDYREMIYLYGLNQRISYEECEDMVEVFETYVYKDTVIAQNTHTLQLWNMFRAHCHEPREKFIEWMCCNAGFFKGYSKIALSHFMEIKREMLSYIRREAREELFWLLAETNFSEWAEENQVKEEEYEENISRYIRNMSRRKDRGQLSEEMKEAITKLNWVANSSKEKTTDLLAELYASAIESDGKSEGTQKRIRYKSRERFQLPKEFFFMTDKHISQIIGIAQLKEKEIRLSQALGCLKHEEGVCPEWIGRLLEEYNIQPPENAGEARKFIQKLLSTQEQRCHLVQREDLLPLIHYVAQKRYERSLQGQNDRYRCENARIFFIEMANTILEECQMAPVSEEYQLDYLLLSCYGKDYMYSLADVIEESEMIKTCQG